MSQLVIETNYASMRREKEKRLFRKWARCALYLMFRFSLMFAATVAVPFVKISTFSTFVSSKYVYRSGYAIFQ